MVFIRVWDGGVTWTRSLYVHENAGATDLIMDPSNPNVLFAATWDRQRRAWDFIESGSGSAIHRSTDGGTSWEKVTTENSGFPNGAGVGRIGLAVTHKNDTAFVYAVLDNYNRRPKKDKKDDKLTKDEIRNLDSIGFEELLGEKLETFLRENGFPEKYTTEKVKEMVRSQEIQPAEIAAYLENANSLLFDTPVIGAEVYVSKDLGGSWTKTHEDFIDDLFYSYGYYFGQIRLPANDPSKIYIMGVPILKSSDGGATFESINKENVHVDHHALWINPDKPQHLILGNDGGVNISYDEGETWSNCNSPAVGQFYTVNVDMAKPYNIYGGTQDNGVWYGPSTYAYNRSWQSTGDYAFKRIMGGDGMQIAIDTRDNETIYTGFQFGNYYRLDRLSGQRKYITPKHELGERPFRWNWQSPIHLSKHHQDIFYMGSNILFRSLDQGENFDRISPDLTNGGRAGDVAYGTLTSIHESPMKFGLLYTGSDDGLIYRSNDGGVEWTLISESLPKDMWVSRVQASQHEESRLFVTLNGYRWDDFTPYIYVSEDYGDSWRQIGGDLPLEPVNVIREDPNNANILYVGTDHGVYVSIDFGASFICISGALPAASIHDLVIHPRENDLIIGTHGRSFYLTNVEHLQNLDSTILSQSLYVFDPEEVRHSKSWGKKSYTWREAETPKLELAVYADAPGETQFSVWTENDQKIKEWSVELKAGLQYIEYDLSLDPKLILMNMTKKPKKKKEPNSIYQSEEAENGIHYLQAGKYKVRMTRNQTSHEANLVITGDKPKEKKIVKHP